MECAQGKGQINLCPQIIASARHVYPETEHITTKTGERIVRIKDNSPEDRCRGYAICLLACSLLGTSCGGVTIDTGIATISQPDSVNWKLAPCYRPPEPNGLKKHVNIFSRLFSK